MVPLHTHTDQTTWLLPTPWWPHTANNRF